MYAVTLTTFMFCRVPLARSVSVGSQQLQLWVKWQPEGRDKYADFGWPWELWPWPPSSGCSNTSQPAAMWLEGGLQLVRGSSLFTPASVWCVPQYQLLARASCRASVAVHSKHTARQQEWPTQ